MMISAVPAAVVSFSSNRSATETPSSAPASDFGPDYQVELSIAGLALTHPATGITESKMRNVLTRILLETLFGVDANANPDQTESSEQEMVREVVAEPLMEDQFQRMADISGVVV